MENFELAQAAYVAFETIMHNEYIVPFEDLPLINQSAWIAAARKVEDIVREENE